MENINIVLGTSNKDKIKEYAKISKYALYANIRLFILDKEIYEALDKAENEVECADSYSANAENKNKFIRNYLSEHMSKDFRLHLLDKDGDITENNYPISSAYTECAVENNWYLLTEDSGLELVYLDRKPGIYSKRYLGKNTPFNEKVKKLCNELANKFGFKEYDCYAYRFERDVKLQMPLGSCYLNVGAYLSNLIDGEKYACRQAILFEILHNNIRYEDNIGYNEETKELNSFGYDAWLEIDFKGECFDLRDITVGNCSKLNTTYDYDTKKSFISNNNSSKCKYFERFYYSFIAPRGKALMQCVYDLRE